MEKLYKKYYEEISLKIAKELNVPYYKVNDALSSTYRFYRKMLTGDKFDDAIKLINIGKFLPTILSKKIKGLVPKVNNKQL